MPLLLYHSSELDKYRLEAPRADMDTIEWDQEFLTKRLPPSYRLERVIWVLNPRIFPPIPIGTAMFTVYQNSDYPYNTIYINWVAFPIMTNVIYGNFSFIAYKTSIPKTIPIYILNEDIKCRIIIDQETIRNYFLTTPFQDRSLNYDNFVLYVSESPTLFWKATTECLCIPSDDPNDYDTLVECQKDTYKRIKNKTSFTANSAIPLSIMRDQLYPPPPLPYRDIVMMIMSVLIFIMIIWAIYRRRHINTTPDINKNAIQYPDSTR